MWFNQPYLTKNIKVGDRISISGKVDEKKGVLQLNSPDYEIGESNFIHTGRLVPIYPETRGISSKWIRRQTFKILNENRDEITDFLPPEIKNKNKCIILVQMTGAKQGTPDHPLDPWEYGYIELAIKITYR